MKKPTKTTYRTCTECGKEFGTQWNDTMCNSCTSNKLR